jgi:hypothetical protein
MPIVIPTKTQFQASTDLTFVKTQKRVDDTVLGRIDELLDLYHGTENEKLKMMLLGRIYFATDMWVRLADAGDASVNTRRRDDVFAFYTKVVNRLCEITGIEGKQNLLPNWLTVTFGREMTDHGAEVDIEGDSADYMTPTQAAKYKLKFIGGLAYQESWWTNSNASVLANTIGVDRRTDSGIGNRPIATDSGGYVVTISGVFYHGPHHTKSGTIKGRFHSSYTSGEAVRCAGVMKIENGKVIRIDTDSGHYQPGDPHLAMAVEALAAYGVSMKDLRVKPFGKAETSGEAFLAEFNAGRIEFTDARYRGAPVRRALDEARVGQVLSGHEARLVVMASFTLFKKHWLPKGAGPGAHGHMGKEGCMECKALRHHWVYFEAAVSRAGGVSKVEPNHAAAQLVAPLVPVAGAPVGGPMPPLLGGMVPPVAPIAPVVPQAPGAHRVVMHARRQR